MRLYSLCWLSRKRADKMLCKGTYLEMRWFAWQSTMSFAIRTAEKYVEDAVVSSKERDEETTTECHPSHITLLDINFVGW